MLFGVILILALMPLFIPLLEAIFVGAVAYSIVSHPLALLNGWRWSLGAHPIFGISASLLAVYFYFASYVNRAYAIVVGLLFSGAWTLIALEKENGGKKLQELLSNLSQSDWSRIDTPQGATSFLLALYVLVVSVGLRFAFHQFFKASKARPSTASGILTVEFVRRKLKALFALLVFSGVCFVLLKACSSSPGLGR
jgi:hypothetical protein